MKKLLFILPLVLLLMLAACTADSPSPAGAGKYVCPEKPAMSEEDQALADRYYELMKEKYPEFGAIPREYLLERVDGGEYKNVTFKFCIGGYETGYECDYSEWPACPEGAWELFGEEFARYSDCALTQDEVDTLKGMLVDSIGRWVEERDLEKGELSPETLVFFWSADENGLYAQAEHIVSVQEQDAAEYGCIDHAHVFGKVLVEFSDNGAKFTDLGAIGS